MPFASQNTSIATIKEREVKAVSRIDFISRYHIVTGRRIAPKTRYLQIGVVNRVYYYLSHVEIGGGKRVYQYLSGRDHSYPAAMGPIYQHLSRANF
jgi:hypothetical protein